MDVIAEGPTAWYLLRDGDALLLEARCSHSAVDYGWLVELNAGERAGWAERGGAWIDELAQAIHYSAPGVIGNNSPYRDRKVDAARGQQVGEAIAAWIKARDA